MRILLVKPPAGRLSVGLRHLARLEPLALEILGAAAAGHEVELLDMELDPDLPATLRRFRPHVVGTTAQIVQTYTALEILRQSKEHNPRTLTLLGGHHATLCPDDFRARQVDAIALGEGVAPFREILEAWRPGASACVLQEVPGLALLRDGQLLMTPARTIPDTLDHQPLPDRSLTAPYRSRYFYLHEAPVAVVQTSMGCPYSCSFCSCQAFSRRRFVPRAPELVAEELARLEEEFVIFADDHSFTDVSRMYRLAELIARRGIRKRFFVYSRVDTVVRHPDVFRAWGRIGLKLVMTGLEALDDATLDSFDKRTRAEMNERALEILGRAGIGVSAGFLILPHHTEEDFRRIEAYVEAHPNIVLAEFTPLTPLPGTGLYEEERGRLVTHHRELYDLAHFVVPTRLSEATMRRLLRKYYGREARRAVRRLRLWRPRYSLQPHMPRLLMNAALDWWMMGRTHGAVAPPARA